MCDMKENDARLEIRLPAPLREKLSQQAVAERRSLANLTRRILEEAVEPGDESLRHTWPPAG
jgi:hypothetical protein